MTDDPKYNNSEPRKRGKRIRIKTKNQQNSGIRNETRHAIEKTNKKRKSRKRQKNQTQRVRRNRNKKPRIRKDTGMRKRNNR